MSDPQRDTPIPSMSDPQRDTPIPSMSDPQRDTRGADYSERLDRLEGARWKRWLDVQAPYRWNLKRLDLGMTLDVGCGIGRNLQNLGGRGVGVDHNRHSVERARERGFQAFHSDDFPASEYAQPGRFDSLLIAHVLEHMPRAEAAELVRVYLRFLRPGGRVVLITPQEAGYRSDSTHVEFLDGEALRDILVSLGLEVERVYSFPFPRPVGRVFLHNEFVALGRTGPTNPTDPTDPTNATDPTDPTDPTNATDPIDPTNPTDRQD